MPTQLNSALSQVDVAGVDCTAQYHGLAIDVGRQKLYYADQAEPAGKVGELSTDGTGHRVLIAVNDSKPRGLVIDDVNRFETNLHQRYKNWLPH